MSSNEEGSSSAIVVEQVKKHYGKVEALKGVSLTVEKGEIFGLIGANGAGKSTLMKILVGSSKPNAGTVEVLGLNPFKRAAELRRQIGYMPQVLALYEDLTPRDNISFFGKAHSLDNLEKRIDEILEFTSLREREKDVIYNFSGGMKQRVSLACALVHKPRALFLDEPTAGIDPKLREAFWQHFRDLAAEGVTLFISTHQMDEAILCNRIAIMQDGVVLANDTPQNILRRGQSRVKIWQNGQVKVKTVTNYPEQLPSILQRYNLDATISKIEIEEDTLETVVLGLINYREAKAAPDKEAENVVHV